MLDIAIVGGGVAGLTTAIACQEAGRNAHIFESAPAFETIGASLSIWPNALACLGDWGLANEIASLGHPINSVAWRRASGEAYYELGLEEIYSKLGYSGICIRRADLHARLVSAVRENTCHTGHRLAQVTKHDAAVELVFENGERVKARHVIAADGIWSTLRASVVNDGPPKYAGYGAWLGLSPAPAPSFANDEAAEYFGPNGRMGILETGNDTRYWYVIANRDIPIDRAGKAKLSDVLVHLQDWPDYLKDIASQSRDEGVIYVSFYERSLASKGGDDQITLVGDAIHPFAPNLGQGACQAIEDGHAIGRALMENVSLNDFSVWIKNDRSKRVEYINSRSTRIGQLIQKNAILSTLTRNMMGWEPARQNLAHEFRRQFTLPDGVR